MNSDSTSVFDSDVGILKLLEPLEFNENVKPVCLPEASFNPEESGETVKGVVSGWGQTDAGIDNNSPLHVGISLRSALNGTLSGSLSVTLADDSWKSPLIEDKKYN